MKPIYCSLCGARLPTNTQKYGGWMSNDGKQNIPLYFCNSECLFRHIFAPTTIKHDKTNENEEAK